MGGTMALKGCWAHAKVHAAKKENEYPISETRLEINALLAQRDRIAAADSRTDVQIFLGDPPHDRSALALAQKQQAANAQPRNYLKIDPVTSQGVTVEHILKVRERSRSKSTRNRKRHRTG
jgi:hypothetical protein